MMTDTPSSSPGTASDVDVAAIRARLEAIPKGEVYIAERDGLLFVGGALIGQFGKAEHAKAYAAAPADIRALLSENERLKELVRLLTPSAVLEAIRAGNFVEAASQPAREPDTTGAEG